MAIAPGRERRPNAAREARLAEPDRAELDGCPFCRGREDRTPPEVLRLGEPWQVRVVPNLYPAFERHEVVVHSPSHVRSIADLSDEELALVARAWQERAAAAGPPFALVNEGRAAGGSLAHSHSQLVWLPHGPPPARGHGAAELEVSRRPGVVLWAAEAPRQPYELLVAPAGDEAEPWASGLLAPALALAAEGLRRVRGAVGPCAANLWLLSGEPWRIELVPRLSPFAGLELGAGAFIGTVAPEDAAAVLRG